MKLSQLSLILIREDVGVLERGIPKKLQQLFTDVFDDFPEQKTREAFRWYLADRDEDGVGDACSQIADELLTEDDLGFIAVAVCVLRKHDVNYIKTIIGIIDWLRNHSNFSQADVISECCAELEIDLS